MRKIISIEGRPRDKEGRQMRTLKYKYFSDGLTAMQMSFLFRTGIINQARLILHDELVWCAKWCGKSRLINRDITYTLLTGTDIRTLPKLSPSLLAPVQLVALPSLSCLERIR